MNSGVRMVTRSRSRATRIASEGCREELAPREVAAGSAAPAGVLEERRDVELWLQACSRATTSDLNSRLGGVGNRLQTLESHLAPTLAFSKGLFRRICRGL